MSFFLSSPAAVGFPLPNRQLACSRAPPPPIHPPAAAPPPPALTAKPIDARKPKPIVADSTDWIASAITRRFGLGAGLAWAGFLAAGVVSEQIKTRVDVSREESSARDVDDEDAVTLPNGVRYYEMRVGGGAIPAAGDLVVVNLRGRVLDGGEVFVDTFGEGRRPMALLMGSRPYARGMCEGVEYVLRSMRAGGRRRVIVPPAGGFGDDGAEFGGAVRVPPGAMLEFVVQLEKVSIAPS